MIAYGISCDFPLWTIYLSGFGKACHGCSNHCLRPDPGTFTCLCPWVYFTPYSRFIIVSSASCCWSASFLVPGCGIPSTVDNKIKNILWKTIFLRRSRKKVNLKKSRKKEKINTTKKIDHNYHNAAYMYKWVERNEFSRKQFFQVRTSPKLILHTPSLWLFCILTYTFHIIIFSLVVAV